MIHGNIWPLAKINSFFWGDKHGIGLIFVEDLLSFLFADPLPEWQTFEHDRPGLADDGEAYFDFSIITRHNLQESLAGFFLFEYDYNASVYLSTCTWSNETDPRWETMLRVFGEEPFSVSRTPVLAGSELEVRFLFNDRVSILITTCGIPRAVNVGVCLCRSVRLQCTST